MTSWPCCAKAKIWWDTLVTWMLGFSVEMNRSRHPQRNGGGSNIVIFVIPPKRMIYWYMIWIWYNLIWYMDIYGWFINLHHISSRWAISEATHWPIPGSFDQAQSKRGRRAAVRSPVVQRRAAADLQGLVHLGGDKNIRKRWWMMVVLRLSVLVGFWIHNDW